MNAVADIIDFDQRKMLQAALGYAARGWHVLPCFAPIKQDDGSLMCGCRNTACQSPGKHPHGFLARRGQMDATTDPETIKRWFAYGHQLNIAIQLSQSGLCAIDIDPRNGGELTLENVEAKYGKLRSDVEQLTGGGGQHFVYSNPHGIQALPGKLGPGIDVKANGYIMVWPSLHVSGLLYEWEASSDPIEGAIPSPLPDWLRDLAGPKPAISETQGSRYAPPEQIVDIRDALSHISADDYHDWINVGQALKAIGGSGFELWDEWSKTSDKYSGHAMGPKWRSFKSGAFQIESIFHMAMANGWANTSTPAIEPDVPMAEPDAPPMVAIPEDYKYEAAFVGEAAIFDDPIPGVLGQFEEWAFRSSLSATPSRHAARMAALAFGSITLARRYKTQRDNYSSLLFLQIDESGGGKEDLKTAIDKAMRQTGLHEARMGSSWYTSEIGVISALHDKPAHINIVDEFGLKVANSRKKGNATSASALSAVMEASTKCHSSISSTAAGTRGLNKSEAARMQMTIVNPGLTVVAMSTRSSMIEALTADDITSGFLNRWVVMVNPAKPEEPDFRRFFDAKPSQPLPSSIADWVSEHCPFPSVTAPDAADAAVDVDATVVPFTRKAQALVIQYLHDIEKMKATIFSSAPEMTKRMNELAMRLSLIIAISDGRQEIDAPHFAWARNFITSHQIASFRMLASQLSGTEFGKLRNRILEFIRTRNDGHEVTRRELGRTCRAWIEAPKHMRDSAIAVLIEDGLIAREDKKSLAGRTSPVYVALSEDTQDS